MMFLCCLAMWVIDCHRVFEIGGLAVALEVYKRSNFVVCSVIFLTADLCLPFLLN